MLPKAAVPSQLRIELRRGFAVLPAMVAASVVDVLQEYCSRKGVAGAVTVVVTRDGVQAQVDCAGLADTLTPPGPGA